MFFKREVFNQFLFDENLSKYALAEDFDFTYRITKKYKNSLVLTPNSEIVHRVSQVERYPTLEASYMNQVHHFYLNYKNFNSNIKEKIIFIWCILGIFLLRTALFIKTRRKNESSKLKFFFKSLLYTIENLSEIKKGKIKI
jgi:GT2 family glycosyltransferase